MSAVRRRKIDARISIESITNPITSLCETMNSRPSTSSLVSDEQDREEEERPGDFEEGEEEEDDNDNDNDEDDEDDGGEDGEGDGDELEGINGEGGSEIEKFARASASGSDKPLEDYVGTQFGADGTVGKKRERSNAKAVECLDMEGNMIELFRSGMAASMKLGIPQGDISLCCRGLKPSVMGLKFRFFGETEEKQAQRLKKGFVLEGVGLDSNTKIEMTRTTRASRGEYGQGRSANDLPSRSLLDPAELKSRKWHLEKVKAGPFVVSKWIPSTPEPTPALHSRIPKNAAEAKLNKSKRRRTVNRLSIGSTAPSKYVYDEPM